MGMKDLPVLFVSDTLVDLDRKSRYQSSKAVIFRSKGHLKRAFVSIFQNIFNSPLTWLKMFFFSLICSAFPSLLLRLSDAPEAFHITLVKDVLLLSAETYLIFLFIDTLLRHARVRSYRCCGVLGGLQVLVLTLLSFVVLVVYLAMLVVDYLAFKMLRHKLMSYEALCFISTVSDISYQTVFENINKMELGIGDIMPAILCGLAGLTLFMWSKRQLLVFYEREQLIQSMQYDKNDSMAIPLFMPNNNLSRHSTRRRLFNLEMFLAKQIHFRKRFLVPIAIFICILIPYLNIAPLWWSPVLNQAALLTQVTTTTTFKLASKYHYSKPRMIIPDRVVKAKKLPNVVLILNDSLGRKHLSLERGHEAAPFLHQFLNQSDVYDFLFSQAITGTTDTAAPAILTGTSMIDNGNRTATQLFVDLPTFSTLAKYYSYSTSIYTPCPTFFSSFNWPFLTMEMNEFDNVHSITTMKFPAVNEFCGDDRLLIPHFRKHLQEGKISKAEPFYTLFYFSNNHVPFLAEEGFHAPPGTVKDYEKYYSSIRITDYLVKNIVQSLKEYGLYDDTVIVFTADHGETPGEPATRTSTPRHEVLSVPFYFRLPDNLVSQEKMKTFRENRQRPVSTKDIFYTLADLLGYDQAVQRPYLDSHLFHGQSLFSPISNDRIRIGYQGPPFFPGSEYHVVVSNATHVLRLGYDRQTVLLERDSALPFVTRTEMHWRDLTPEDQSYWRSCIAKHPSLMRKIGINVGL